MKIKVVLCLSVFFFSDETHGNVSQQLTQFFHALGGAANVSHANAYRDQTAGYYTGGNLFARNSVHTSQLAAIQLPDFRAGCGGIDMFMGAFSHISSDKLIEALKAIGSNMASYALLLAIETMSPQIKNIITELNDLAQKINQSNLNSCELAATTLGAVWPKSDVAQNHLCKMIGSDKKYGGFSDYAASRQGCGAEGKREMILKSGANDPRFQSMVGSEFNLAWRALQQNAFLMKDPKLAEFFLSISGTIISKKREDGTSLLHTKPSLSGTATLISALLYGGEAHIYRCKDPECLDVAETRVTIDQTQALCGLVRQLLDTIQTKIYTDEPLSAAEIAFLNSTRLPFYKILNVATAYRRGGAPVDVLDYAELAAIDILFQYLSEILNVVSESVAHFQLAQVDDTHIKRFQHSLNQARLSIMQRRTGSFKQIEQVMGIVSKTELLEKSLMLKASVLSRGE